MKIALAQIHSKKGAIDQNIQKHIDFIQKAHLENADLILFPELGLSGYEPEMANDLAMDFNDNRFEVFKTMSDEYQMAILLSFPLKSKHKPCIALKIFLPNSKALQYKKMCLHDDELPFFEAGKQPFSFEFNSLRFTTAICYESLLKEHNELIKQHQSDVYLASVDKPKNGMQRALKHYPKIANQYKTIVAVANSIGPSDNFISNGHSAAWNSDGNPIAALNETEENLLLITI